MFKDCSSKKVLSVTCQTSQSFIRIMNMLVTFYSNKVGFFPTLYDESLMKAGCNFHNQLLFTACCFITVGWIKANRVSSLPILLCPLTVYVECNNSYTVKSRSNTFQGTKN